MATVLVIAAHPDDEALGCGATLARHADAGDIVHILIVGEGETARGAGEGAVTARSGAANAAATALGALPPRLLGLPDNRLDSLPLLDIVQAIETVLNDVGPDIVYTHHAGDLNIDHRIVHQATLTACRPLPGHSVRELYAFEVLSSTEWASGAGTGFAPTRFVDVGRHMARKLAALRCYDQEMRPFPHSRSYEAVEALATLRGANVGCQAAEAFEVIRQIIAQQEA